MKTRNLLWCMIVALLSTVYVYADEITVEAKSVDISESLDLTAVANLFGQVKNVEEFEAQLNKSENQLSNLDLNGDGEVDYLRCVEEDANGVHYVLIQAVLAKDVYQDVATILVEKDAATSNVNVQVVGDPYIYGVNYIIEPVYIYRPYIYDYFWSPYWCAWHSPYYWGFYHPWYHHHHCMLHHLYHHHIFDYNRMHHCSYRRPMDVSPAYRNHTPAARRDDFARQNPSQSFSSRNANTGYRNARDVRAASRGNAMQTNRSVSNASVRNNTMTSARGTSSFNNTSRVNATNNSRATATSTRAVVSTSNARGNSTAARSTTSTTATRTTPANTSRGYSSHSSSAVRSSQSSGSYRSSSPNVRSSSSSSSYRSSSSYSGGSSRSSSYSGGSMRSSGGGSHSSASSSGRGGGGSVRGGGGRR